jgi:Tol biopolymer transport system component
VGLRQWAFGPDSKLILVDSAGRELRVFPARVPWSPRFSPDGRRVAHGAYAPGRDSADVWITDVASGATQRLTTDGNDNNDPVWSPDGQWIAYDKDAPGGKDLYVQPIDGGPARRLTDRPGVQWPTDWRRGVDELLVTEWAMGDMSLLVQPLKGGTAPPYVATPAWEAAARLSPNGRWVAYQSDESGRSEVYVQSYPVPGHKTVVSTGGGVNPVWSGDGRTLHYWKVDQLIAARVEEVSPDAPLAVRSRTTRFRLPYVENLIQNYDVSPDGRRFVVVTAGGSRGRLVVALDALGRR